MNTILKNLKAKFVLAFLFVSFSATTVQAQDGFEEDVDDEVAAAPIDGFLVSGLIAGAVLGIRKIRKSEK